MIPRTQELRACPPYISHTKVNVTFKLHKFVNPVNRNIVDPLGTQEAPDYSRISVRVSTLYEDVFHCVLVRFLVEEVIERPLEGNLDIPDTFLADRGADSSLFYFSEPLFHNYNLLPRLQIRTLQRLLFSQPICSLSIRPINQLRYRKRVEVACGNHSFISMCEQCLKPNRRIHLVAV